MQAGDHERAAACFGRLADDYPEGRHWRQAQLRAGGALEALERWYEALERYAYLWDSHPDVQLPELRFRIVSCLYNLERYDDALMVLAPLLSDPDLPLQQRIQALTYAGICRVESGDLDRGEEDFRRVLMLRHRNQGDERIDDYHVNQAQFFLGEIYRLHFEAKRLETVDDPEALRDELEQKAQLLLSAQGHYMRTARMGHPHWTTAALQRIGNLYETLYDEMLDAPIPSNLTESQAELYREVLRDKVRILVQKAISVYERNLAAAERVGVRSPFIDWTRQSLERMRRLLLEEYGVGDGPGGGTEAASPRPERREG